MDILSDINVSGTLTIGNTKLNEIVAHPSTGETMTTSTITIMGNRATPKRCQIKYDPNRDVIDYGSGLFYKITVETMRARCANVIEFCDKSNFYNGLNVSRGKVVFEQNSQVYIEDSLNFCRCYYDGVQSNYFKIFYNSPTKPCAVIESSLEAMKQVFFNDTIPADCQKFRMNLFAFFNQYDSENGGFSKCPLLQMVDNSTHKVVYPDFEFVFEEEKDRQYVAVDITMEHSDEIEACRFTLTVF